jgi:glycosyltransferase involved in cell wall biosynthesis
MSTTTTESQDAVEEHDGSHLLLSVVIPCLNEAQNIELCVTSALGAMAGAGIAGEVIVADNGSEDGSAELAESAGACVVHQPVRGYGSAYRAGFAAARGEYIVMADADLTYDFAEIPRFLAELQDGADMIVGDRMRNIQPGAMPWLHRYIGNPLLSRFLTCSSIRASTTRTAACGASGAIAWRCSSCARPAWSSRRR